MRLRHIEAVRFGALEDSSLRDLDPGLTVVLGPNEAGKTTYAELVRHVLYGFPYQREVESGYEPLDGGKRLGRLVFTSADGEWAVERADGARRGSVTVTTLHGEERPGLLDDLTRGVSRQAFAVVFGFGLDELAEIERLRGSDDDVIGRLYAAGAGLAVSPLDVRTAMAQEAEAVFAPSARSRVLNALASREREIRAELAGIAARAESFAQERARLERLQLDSQDAKAAREAAAARAAELERAALELGETEARLEEAEARSTERRRSEARLTSELETLVVDEAALAAAPEVDALLAGLSAFERDREAIRERQIERDGPTIELAGIVQDADLPEDVLTSLPTDAEMLAETDRRARLVEARELQLEQSRDAAVLSASAVAGARPRRLEAIALGVAGVLSAVVGTLSDEWVVVGLGALLLVLGVLLALRRGSDAAAPSTVPTNVAAAESALESAVRDWSEWVARLGLPADSVPAQARRYLGLADRARRLRMHLAEISAAEDRLRDSTRGFATSLRQVASSFLDLPSEVEEADVAATAARAREAVAAARTAAARRSELERELARVGGDLAGAQQAEGEARGRAIEILARNFGDGGSLLELQHLAADARDEATTAAEHAEARASERDTVAGSLSSATEDPATSDLKLELAGIRERMADATERYLVHHIATRLLDEARERYERERQPEVVRRAQDVFRRITAERYVGLAIPLGDAAIRVADEASQAKTSPHLSRGTAEQMYLALRLGLLASLGDVGAGLPVLMDDVLVNFDPDRARGAAEAVAELASSRQVVLFTCHPATLELFQEVAEPAVIRLGHC